MEAVGNRERSEWHFDRLVDVVAELHDHLAERVGRFVKHRDLVRRNKFRLR